MKTKETDSTIPFFPLQTGDRIKKAGKEGEVIEVSNDNSILVMWKNGNMTREEGEKLEKVTESIFSTYLKAEKRI